MLSRRKFIKLTGIAGLSAASGFGFGRILKGDSQYRFALYGYLPDDKSIILKTARLFFHSLKINSEMPVFADIRNNEIIKGFSRVINFNSILKNRTVIIKLEMLKHNVNADLVISDNINPVYPIEKDFNNNFLPLRNTLSGLKAGCFFAMEYFEQDNITALLNNRKKYVVIESDNGIVDRIPINKNYNGIHVNGPQGKTVFRINNESVKVTHASCRHKICEGMGYAFKTGDVIACAPNRVLIRIEES